MSLKLKSAKIKLGDVYQISLPDGRYAYGRIFKDACIAIYKEVSSSVKFTPQKEEYMFIVGVYEDVLKSGKWRVIDNRPFASDDESWPSPMYIVDPISGEYSQYHKGQIISSTKEQCSGLEEAVVWEEHHIVDRIMNN